MTPSLGDALASLGRNVEGGLHHGAQLYVSHCGTALINDAVGTRDGVRPMSSATMVPWMCAGKPLTSIAIGRLVDAGRLGFDDPVSTHIPEWVEAAERGVTIRHLLTHTVPFVGDVAVGTFATSWERIIRRIIGTPFDPGADPGTVARYTVLSSWYLLGEIIQRVSGDSIVDHIHNEVIAPLGLGDCSLGVDGIDASAELAELFDTTSGRPRPSFLIVASGTGLASPGLGAWGTAEALGRLYEQLVTIRSGLWDVAAAGEAPIAPETLSVMTSAARENLHCAIYASNIEWGLGFITDRRIFCGRRSGPSSFGHDGRNASIAFADPDHDLVISIVTNGMPRPTRSWRRFRNVIESVYDELGIEPRRSREPSELPAAELGDGG